MCDTVVAVAVDVCLNGGKCILNFLGAERKSIQYSILLYVTCTSFSTCRSDDFRPAYAHVHESCRLVSPCLLSLPHHIRVTQQGQHHVSR